MNTEDPIWKAAQYRADLMNERRALPTVKKKRRALLDDLIAEATMWLERVKVNF